MIKKIKKIAISAIMASTLLATPVMAAEPKFVSGAKKLATDAGVWLLALIPLIAAGAIGWQSIKKMLNDDEGITAKCNHRMKQILIAAAIGESAAAIIAAFTAYFL